MLAPAHLNYEEVTVLGGRYFDYTVWSLLVASLLSVAHWDLGQEADLGNSCFYGWRFFLALPVNYIMLQ